MLKKNSQKIAVILVCTAFLISGVYYTFRENSRVEASLNDSEATPDKVSEVVNGNNKFTFELYSQLSKENSNVFFSPWSIYTAMTMTYEGAKGETATEMRDVLHLPENGKVRQPAFARIQNLLNENLDYTLETANALWSQKDYNFLEKYLDTIREYYGGKISNLDFKSAPEEARQTINDWVSDKTRDKIEELIKKSMIKNRTRLILTNAIYFKGEWATQFDEEKTEKEDFWKTSQEKVSVDMMKMDSEETKFKYTETEDLKALEMPYEGGDVSMTILLPKSRTGLDELEDRIDPQMLESIKSKMNKEEVNIHLPKFEMKTRYKMGKTFENMGMKKAFTPNVANLSGMDGTKKLYIEFVTHKAYVKVNEKGTEATAATGVGAGVTSVGPGSKNFIADHPFMFLIEEKETGNILFMGSVMNPAA